MDRALKLCDGLIAISTKTPFGFLWSQNGNYFQPTLEEKRDIQIKNLINSRSLAYARWSWEVNIRFLCVQVFKLSERKSRIQDLIYPCQCVQVKGGYRSTRITATSVRIQVNCCLPKLER
ncbi:hypothetical protein TNCV_4222681 [Trichonephila clavipes]|nr:hypothetical protein TNCV_4222681 [Trichonephila clavipes]